MTDREYYFGIDLGTTNSSIAVSHENQVRVLPNSNGDLITPSVVHVDEIGRMTVGKAAYETWAIDPANTQAEFKRWIGFSDELAFPASGRSMSAEDLSTEVLKSLLQDAQRQTGLTITTAVITVPAAFGQLQCDATTRAAAKAGLNMSPLLQEPIATALAYGADVNAGDQRWLVFDLGGGTLDIAIVSTRNGRLAVLEHRGDNRLGGKDMDRAIAAELLLPPLAGTFDLPDAQRDPTAFNGIFRRLIRHAELAKVALSNAESVEIKFLDLGKDRQGRPIELTLSLGRTEMIHKIQPLLDRCLALVNQCLSEARLPAGSLTRILGVGGPTRMPCIQQMLGNALSVPVDCSLDPMTVVAQGAARFSAGINCAVAVSGKADDTAPESHRDKSRTPISISHERASATLRSPVGGVVPATGSIAEVCLAADSGRWTSGWLPIKSGRFSTTVQMDSKAAVTRFTITARNKSGVAVPLDPSGFSIALATPLAAPPLPHTIAVEITDIHDTIIYDPLFKRDCALPAETRRTYRADRALRTSDPQGRLPIKFWEVDVSEDPGERWWAGCVGIQAARLKRPIPEGADIELNVKIDASRKISVEAFIPIINQRFVDNVYLPDPPSARSHLQMQLDSCFERLNNAYKRIYPDDRADLSAALKVVQNDLDRIALEAASGGRSPGSLDPDVLLREAATLRRISVRLAQVEEQLGSAGDNELADKVRADLWFTSQLCADEGTGAERRRCADLQRKFEEFMAGRDIRGLHWIKQELDNLAWEMVNRAPGFWGDCLAAFRIPGNFSFVNRQEADKRLAAAEKAQQSGNIGELRRCIHDLFELVPDQEEDARSRDSESGLRGG